MTDFDNMSNNIILLTLLFNELYLKYRLKFKVKSLIYTILNSRCYFYDKTRSRPSLNS